MFSHFNMQVFINALKANQNLVTFLRTTLCTDADPIAPRLNSRQLENQRIFTCLIGMI